MKKLLPLIFVLIAYSYAKININSFVSDFVQTITNDQNKTITYKGKLYFKAPNKVRWIYTKPLHKEIFILGPKMVIIEPDLEQAVVKTFNEEKTLAQIIQDAKKVDKNRYVGTYKGKKYTIWLTNGVLHKITYQDRMQNRVTITFSHPKQNIEINDSVFTYTIDPDFDVIYQ